MRLLVMRHGISEDSRGSDFARRLTDRGIKGVRSSAAELVKKRVMPTRVIASPLVRAQQTAAIMVQEIHLTAPILTSGEITPSGIPEDVVEMLQADVMNELCLLVSHQPFVSILIEYLASTRVYMDTADIACLSMDVFAPNSGDLEWLVHA